MNVIIKRIAAVILMVAFFLPLSQCRAPTPPTNDAQELKMEVTYAYSAYQWPGAESFAAFFAFFWPVMFSFLGRVKSKLLINSIELLLCVGTGFMLFALTYMGSLLLGAYVAIALLVVYSLATANQIRKRLSGHALQN
jgi:hypothetical protein